MNPFVCARCAGTAEAGGAPGTSEAPAATGAGTTCCRLAPGPHATGEPGEVCFPLSEVEKDRIREFAPHRGVFALAANSEAFVGRMLGLFPRDAEAVAALFPARKDHFRLATDRTGRCAFLGRTGCRLPVEARPYHCRLFPVWFSAGRATVLADPGCLALREAPSMARLLDSLGLNLLRARDLHGRLRLAWGLPPREGMPAVPKAFARYTR